MHGMTISEIVVEEGVSGSLPMKSDRSAPHCSPSLNIILRRPRLGGHSLHKLVNLVKHVSALLAPS